jgi:hypothetical protein
MLMKEQTQVWVFCVCKHAAKMQPLSYAKKATELSNEHYLYG